MHPLCRHNFAGFVQQILIFLMKYRPSIVENAQLSKLLVIINGWQINTLTSAFLTKMKLSRKFGINSPISFEYA